MTFYTIEFYSMMTLIYVPVMYALWVEADTEDIDINHRLQIVLWPVMVLILCIYVAIFKLLMLLKMGVSILGDKVEGAKLLWKAMDLDDEG